MAWIEPKTDWVSTDYFNAEDYNRIKNNIGHLKTLTDKLFSGFNWALGYNLIPFPYYDSAFEENGISWAVDNDGVIVANGKATVNESFICRHRISHDKTPLILSAGTYTLTGCPIGGGSRTYYVNVGKSDPTTNSFSVVCIDFGNGATFTIEKETQVYVGCSVANGYTVNNVTFKPMLVRGSEPMEFHPYYETMPNATTDLLVVDKDKNYLSLIYAREINNIEKSLETLNVKTYKLNIGETQEYMANTRTPNFEDLNRIESAILLLYNTMVAHKNALPRLAFILGGQKGIRV